MPRCIYCLTEKPGEDFNRDHVLPIAFGSFAPRNLILEKTVCSACNKLLGDCLEVFLAYDTGEGVLRYDRGVRRPAEYQPDRIRRVRFTVERRGFWHGAKLHVIYDPVARGLRVNPMQQVGFRHRATNEWTFFELSEIRSRDDLETLGFVTRGADSIKLIFEDDAEYQEMVRVLQGKGIPVEKSRHDSRFIDEASKEIDIMIHTTLDKTIRRAIAKIAFNYMAWSETAAMALQGDFDAIRTFIFKGEGSNQLVTLLPAPILEEERRFGIQTTNGHIVTISWDKGLRTIAASVSLFNLLHYRVLLCRHYTGIFHEIASGHLFDIDSRHVSRLVRISRNLLLSR